MSLLHKKGRSMHSVAFINKIMSKYCRQRTFITWRKWDETQRKWWSCDENYNQIYNAILLMNENGTKCGLQNKTSSFSYTKYNDVISISVQELHQVALHRRRQRHFLNPHPRGIIKEMQLRWLIDNSRHRVQSGTKKGTDGQPAWVQCSLQCPLSV